MTDSKIHEGDEAVLRKDAAYLAEVGGYKGTLLGLLALLDAKDAEIASLRAYITEAEGCDTALSRAEQAEARVAELTTALAKQTEQQDYPCSPHCAGYLREQDALAKLEQAEAALAEERKAHQAFREEVAAAWLEYRDAEPAGAAERRLEALILPAEPADKLAEAWKDAWPDTPEPFIAKHVARLRAAIERAGGTISFEGEG